MHYVVEYDLVSAGFQYWWAVIAGIAGLTAFGFLRRISYSSKNVWISGLLLLVSSPFVLIGSLTAVSYCRLTRAIASGEYGIEEGIVSQFRPMPIGEHATESFVVNGRRFEYAQSVIYVGFHQTAVAAGPIAEGARVRIRHVGPIIVRLEIER